MSIKNLQRKLTRDRRTEVQRNPNVLVKMHLDRIKESEAYLARMESGLGVPACRFPAMVEQMEKSKAWIANYHKRKGLS